MTHTVFIYRSTRFISKCQGLGSLFFVRNASNTTEFNIMESEKIKKEKIMIVGLCNHDLPKTRHSIGLMLVNRLASYLDVTLKKDSSCSAMVASVSLSHLELVLMTPKLAMNLNGRSVQKTATAHKVSTSNIYLAHDDLDRKVGKVSIKERGSAGGHNGVRSAIQCLKSEEMPRLRVGVDRPVSTNQVGVYVLSPFTRAELPVIDKALNEGVMKLAQHIGNRLDISPTHVFQKKADQKPGATNVDDSVT